MKLSRAETTRLLVLAARVRSGFVGWFAPKQSERELRYYDALVSQSLAVHDIFDNGHAGTPYYVSWHVYRISEQGVALATQALQIAAKVR